MSVVDPVPVRAKSPVLDADYTLEHKYTRGEGRIYLSGVQGVTFAASSRSAGAVQHSHAHGPHEPATATGQTSQAASQ